MQSVGPYGRWSYGPTNLEIVHITLLVVPEALLESGLVMVASLLGTDGPRCKEESPHVAGVGLEETPPATPATALVFGDQG